MAPTGVAAINAGGVTIHSFFQLPFGPFIANHRQGWDASDQQVVNSHTLFKNIRLTTEKRKLIEELDLIIIDEVSMMRCDTLDAIDHVLRHFRQKPHLPFGGVQIIYIGDLHQLPPVIKNDEWTLLKQHYASPFFFEAKVLAQQPPLFIELKKIYRQSDDTFINILNNIRNNKITETDLDILQQYYYPSFSPAKEDNYITLTSHNAKADSINQRELEKLQGETICYTGEMTGEFNDKVLPVDMNLILKQGAQIMFIKNDKGEKRRYYNGKIAIISRLTEDKIYVQFPGNEYEMEIEKETWTNIRYVLNDETNKLEEEEIGSYKQYPIRLAWAITIHKSQGLTFDKAIIDAGSSFAAGQVYVALSRLTSLEGLKLYSQITPDSIRCDSRVLNFIQTEQTEESLTKILQAEQIIFTNRMLLQSFEWLKMISGVREFIGKYDRRKIPEKEEAVKWAQNIFSKINEDNNIAKKFSRQLKELLVTDAENQYQHLQERVLSAQKYFEEQLSQLESLIHVHKEKYDTHKKVKKYKRELITLTHLLERKRKELRNAVDMAQDLCLLKEKDQASAENRELSHTAQNQSPLLPEALAHQ